MQGYLTSTIYSANVQVLKLEAVVLASFKNLLTFTLVDVILATCVVEHGNNRVSVSPPKASSQLPLDTSIH